jgi:hypothetical protein
LRSSAAIGLLLGAVFGISASQAQVINPLDVSDFDIKHRTFGSAVQNLMREPSPSDTSRLLPSLGSEFFTKNDSGKAKFSVIPLVALESGFSSSNDLVFESSGGIAVRASWKKFSFIGDVRGGFLDQPTYLKSFTDSLGVLPSRGRRYSQSQNVDAFVMPSGALNFKANHIFNFQLGFGRNFFGNGHRSMFLSDVAYNYPYLRIDTDVWNIKYVNVFSALTDVSADPSDANSYRRKYSSTHYFNWAISPRFNLGLFETIIWQGSDTLSNRGFDPNYLNPIIFFRPVEFSIGSPDNAIIGLDLSFKAAKNLVLYGQLVFDEFLLSEFRAREGWWGNKWGAQLGLKARKLFGIENSFLRAEFNLARPFTYTHGSVLQNFGHFNQPLAHPLGTNFYEGLIQAYAEKHDFFFEGQWNIAIYGRDLDSLNLGGNIYRSYANPAEIYGNEIAQGRRSSLFYQRLSAGLILNRHVNLRLSAYYIYRRLDTENALLNNEHIFGIRIATELFRVYTDF